MKNKDIDKENKKTTETDKDAVDNKTKDNETKDTVVKEESSTHDFIVEKIKERPINKKRLTRRMLLTAGMAVLFGCIACLSFLVLEPLFEKMISGHDKDETVLTQVTLTETPEEEMQDYEVTINDRPFDEEETPIENLNLDDSVSEDTVSENIIVNEIKKEIELEDYQLLYRKLYSMSKEVSKSIVVVTTAGKSQDIFNDEFVNTGRTTGLVVAENSNKYLILADAKDLPDGKVIVTFCDGYVTEAVEEAVDEETGLAIYAVSSFILPAETKDKISVATLGMSNSSSIIGTPVIAIGDPMNTGNSVCYGAITSNESRVYVTDASYQLLNTDIFASKKANGVLVNVRGQIVGIICQHNAGDDMKNLISAYGISGIKNLIEDMSNGSEKVYVGLHLKDITSEALVSLNIPAGVYVAKVDMDSPAMNVGIIPSDIISAVNGKDISSVSEYATAIRNCESETVVLTVMRLSGNEYKGTEIEIKLERQ